MGLPVPSRNELNDKPYVFSRSQSELRSTRVGVLSGDIKTERETESER